MQFFRDQIHPSAYMSVMISDMIMDHLATAQRLLFAQDALSKPRWEGLHTTRWPADSVHGLVTKVHRPYRCYAGSLLTDDELPVSGSEGFQFVSLEMVKGHEVPKVRGAARPRWLALQVLGGGWRRLSCSAVRRFWL